MLNELDILFDQGVSLYEKGKLDEAEQKFLEALKFDPTSDDIKYNLALVYLEKNEYDKTNFIISQIKDINCDEIIDELQKVDFEISPVNPADTFSGQMKGQIDEQINYYLNILNDEFLPQNITCEICNSEIELSEIERQNKHYTCPECKTENNVREKERALESEFISKVDSDLFLILIESAEFKTEYVLAAKREIKRRNINLADNNEFKALLNQSD